MCSNLSNGHNFDSIRSGPPKVPQNIYDMSLFQDRLLHMCKFIVLLDMNSAEGQLAAHSEVHPQDSSGTEKECITSPH